jgi:hypothetical protein
MTETFAVRLDDLLQRLLPALASPEVKTAIYVVCALVVGYIIGRLRSPGSSGYSALQNRGEALVTDLLRANFRAPDYHLMNHVTLRLKDGTTQIDHVLVSRFGVFVIETKDYKGWIFGDPTQPRWTQVIFWVRLRFQNPIVQNSGHVRAVQDLLDFLPPDAIKSVVVFTGEAKFKTPIPPGVFYASEVVAYLRNLREEVLSLNRVQFCVGRLETARLEISDETDVEHVQNLQRKHRTAYKRGHVVSTDAQYR